MVWVVQKQHGYVAMATWESTAPNSHYVRSFFSSSVCKLPSHFSRRCWPKHCHREKTALGHSCTQPWCHKESGRQEESSERPAGPLQTHRHGSGHDA